MSLDLSKRIRNALASDSSSKALPDALSAIGAFVNQKDQPDRAILDQLRDELESIYKDVDHSSPANVEAFIAVLHGFLSVFNPLYVITHWWDLVLRTSLRDPRLPSKAVNQAKELTLLGLTADSAKSPEFRKRIFELFLLDSYDESSGQDALEEVTLSEEERKRQKLWKSNLEDILQQYCFKQPQEFFDGMCIFFASSQRRLKLALFFATLIRTPQFPIESFSKHSLLDSLLLSLIVDGSSTLFEVEMAMLTIILPHLAVHSTDTLIRILPFCYAILGRVICWKPRSNLVESRPEDEGLSKSDSSKGSRISDHELDPAATPAIRSDLGWERSDAAFLSFIPDPPSPLPLFSTLYGLYPCNTLEFLRDPAGYLTKQGPPSPFQEDWFNSVDDDQIRTRARVLLRHNILHSSLLTETSESERSNLDKWQGWDVPRIAMMCTMLDARNSALSLRRMPDAFQLPDSLNLPTENLVSDNTPRNYSPLREANGGIQEYQETRFFPGQRARVSVQDIIGTYHILKSGIEIDIVDGSFPEWTQQFSQSRNERSFDTLSEPTPIHSSIESNDSLPAHAVEAISKLQRDNLLLRSELNYELWLKRENVKRIGRLYSDRILIKGAEMERQGLHNKLREYKSQVQRLQHALAKEQTGAATIKAQYADYSRRLNARLMTDKVEKQKWAEEKLKLQSDHENAKALLEAQAKRLAEATENVLKLETEKKENRPKIDRLRDYEDKINQLMRAQRLWDDDIRKIKEQDAYLEDLRSRYRKKLVLIESYENSFRELQSTIQSLYTRIAELKSANFRQQLRPEPSRQVYNMMEQLRKEVVKLMSERDNLLQRNEELNDKMDDLKITIEGLRGRPHAETPSVPEGIEA